VEIGDLLTVKYPVGIAEGRGWLKMSLAHSRDWLTWSLATIRKCLMGDFVVTSVESRYWLTGDSVVKLLIRMDCLTERRIG
jgi:hypothetical protein